MGPANSTENQKKSVLRSKKEIEERGGMTRDRDGDMDAREDGGVGRSRGLNLLT